MATKERWIKAQEYERGYWERFAESITDGSYEQLGFYEWRANQLSDRLRALGEEGLSRGDARILEMGSGPVGVVGFLPGTQRVAVDPLNEMYAEIPKLIELRDPSVDYLAIPGESLPFDDNWFDLIVMENCIDHVRDMDAVMVELHRVLAPGGILYMTVNARSPLGFWVHRVLASTALDPGHPHTFTSRRFRRMIVNHGFELIDYQEASRVEAWLNHLRSPAWKHRVKALLGVAEHVLSAIGRKAPA
jgi:SAM-dependent methyltransferase